MGRPIRTGTTGPPQPSEWPRWIFKRCGGFSADDPARNAEIRTAFQQWQADREQWFEEQGITDWWVAWEAEGRRRR